MMTPPLTRRQFGSFAALGLASLAARAAAADAWPSQPIRVIVPYAAGGVGEVILRLMAPALEQSLGQPLLIDARGGAGGNIGTGAVVRAAPDGYTFLLGATANFAVNQYLYRLNFDPLTQLEPVVAMADAPLLAVVGPAVKATSLKQLSEQVRANSGKFNYGSPGAGSPTHLAGAHFSLTHGNAMEHVVYRGTPPMVQAMVAGDVQLAFPTLTPVAGYLKSGQLRALAVLGKHRLPELPNVPTSAEAGFPDFVFGNWWSLAAPRGIDPAIVQKLGAHVRQQLATPAMKARLGELGHVPLALGAPETAAFVRSEAARYKTLVERTGIRLD